MIYLVSARKLPDLLHSRHCEDDNNWVFLRAQFNTLIPQKSFCCNFQSHTVIENARLKLLTVTMATPPASTLRLPDDRYAFATKHPCRFKVILKTYC